VPGSLNSPKGARALQTKIRPPVPNHSTTDIYDGAGWAGTTPDAVFVKVVVARIRFQAA